MRNAIALSAADIDQYKKCSHGVDKQQTNRSVKNFGAKNGLLVNFDALKGWQFLTIVRPTKFRSDKSSPF